MSEDKKRIFIAINIDEDVRERLSDIQGKLQKCDADVRWVRPENIHLTLRFLGYVSDANLKGIFEASKASIHNILPFEIFFSKIGVFPDLRRPRVIWAGVKEGKMLSTIVYNLNRLLKERGFQEEERSYRPHLTLGRVRSEKHREELAKAIKANENWSGGSQKVREIRVMESILKSEGAHYSSLYAVKLATK